MIPESEVHGHYIGGNWIFSSNSFKLLSKKRLMKEFTETIITYV